MEGDVEGTGREKLSPKSIAAGLSVCRSFDSRRGALQSLLSLLRGAFVARTASHKGGKTAGWRGDEAASSPAVRASVFKTCPNANQTTTALTNRVRALSYGWSAWTHSRSGAPHKTGFGVAGRWLMRQEPCNCRCGRLSPTLLFCVERCCFFFCLQRSYSWIYS